MELKESLLKLNDSAQQVPYDCHFHNAYEMIFVYEGTVEFKIGGSCYQAGPNTMLFISKLEEHNMRIVNGCYRRFTLLMSPSQLEQLIDDPKLRSVFISRPPGFRHAFDLSRYADRVKELLEEMRNEYESPDCYSKQALSEMLGLLMILCYRACKEQYPFASKQYVQAVFDVQNYIDRHFTENIRIKELASRFFISVSYLAHSFREWTGSSPKEYIMRSRIAYAKELLINTDLSVAVIAGRCGFGDVSNFVRSFKKEVSQTPFGYRRKG
ncbi:MAG: AraC family transcriptional regulator [Oscillospiraceae bacterium]|nr:AraC family transcriptional regulator [Oscillospiraceae bacterium]